ncbi:MAG: hypothetical protein H7070_14565 [Saprospiraceae bacterium]|nr:hypothetical protein [Pyrinomonadaceae bacterium]
MKVKICSLILFFAMAFSACGSATLSSNTPGENKASVAADSGAVSVNSGAANIEVETSFSADQPKTIRDFFMLLPDKYFVLEGCERDTDKACRKAKIDYLETFAEIEDTANGYLKGGCDGAQSCLEMAIFKRPDGTYLIGVATAAEMMHDFFFLDYGAGKWTDVSASEIPEFSKNNMYELPRIGTTVKVFAKKIVEKGDDYEVSDKGAKLYDLEWKNGKFSVRK